ncbi:MAG TPA: CBS domain-containing protein [Anaerolineaceae bacterium]|nr:CBS domain-containing protein [Anaerolineaceae bacterium]
MIKVQDLLDQKEANLWNIHPKASILDALKIMSRRDIGALPVVDELGLVGIISERDFIHVIAIIQEYEINRKIEKYMNKEVITVTPETSLDECMHLMAEKHARHLPVMDGKDLVGLISYGDVIRFLVRNEKKIR